MEIKIFVEGIADVKFLKDYISEVYKVELNNEDIIGTKGWTNILSAKSDGEYVRNQMIKNFDNGGINLLIFDADNNYEKRLEELSSWKKKNKLEFEIFLWPNNSGTGDLETVLENIINPKNSPIFNCWDVYEDCLTKTTIEDRDRPLTTPAKKTKIYGYLEALLGETMSQKEKIKEEKRDYKNFEHWDLNSSFLVPLKTFLNQYFQSTTGNKD